MSIVLEHLTKRYEGQPVVNHLSLEITDGEFFVLLGPSGSGKSTILRMIAGLADVDRGRILLHGKNVTALPPQERGTGFVFQHYALFQHMTVAENIEFPLQIRKAPAAERRQRRDELLHMVGLSGLGGRMPRQLSGGQQQRVALARALAHRPQVLLLDEPFGALDAKIRADLRRSLRQIQRELSVTTIFVTHDQEEGFELADRMGVMNVGRLLEVGPPEELYQRPQTEFVATFLGTANLLRGTCTDDSIRVGPLRFPLQTEARDQPASRYIRVLFRPEDVALADAQDELLGSALGQGTVEQSTFSGAFERLRLRIPAIAGVQSIAPAGAFGDESILVDALRSQDQARRFPLRPGAQAWVAVRRIHALAHPALNLLLLTDGSAGAKAALVTGSQIAKLAHARTTLLGYGANPEALQTHLRETQEQIGGGLPAFQTRASADELVQALRGEVERQHYELAVVPIQSNQNLDLVEEILQAGQHHLLLVPQAQPAITEALICVTGGEPGKEDVIFAGQLLRHIGAQATILSILANDEHPRERIERFLEAGVRTLEQRDVPAQTKIREGQAAKEIVAEMNSGAYGLLVLGAPLPGLDGRLALSPVLREVLREMRQHPVLIVRSRYVTANQSRVKQMFVVDETSRSTTLPL
ncbi:MAG TPA: ATP-binding cassette domain-containing protein [Herpetosiphonaceae bacterium]